MKFEHLNLANVKVDNLVLCCKHMQNRCLSSSTKAAFPPVTPEVLRA